MRMTKVIVLLLSSGLTGCASVKVTDKHGTKGFLTYTPVPHLLVEKSKEGVVTTRVISLPDTSRPRYLTHRGGYGSLQFNFALENGMLTTFGQTSDSKIPETVAGLAGVGTLATGVGALHTALNPIIAKAAGTESLQSLQSMQMIKPGTNTTPPTFEFTAVKDAIALINNDVEQPLQARKASHARALRLITEQLAELRKLQQVQIPIGAQNSDPLKGVADHLKPLPGIIKRLTEAHAMIRGIVDGSAATNIDTSIEQNAAYTLSQAIGLLRKLVPEESPVELYRIDTTDAGVMYFTRVPLPFAP